MMSAVTISLRRSNRSASTPANGPKNSPGTTRKRSTPPTANAAFPVGAPVGFCSRATYCTRAKTPSQSPRLETVVTVHSRRKYLRLRRTRRLEGRSEGATYSRWGGCEGPVAIGLSERSTHPAQLRGWSVGRMPPDDALRRELPEPLLHRTFHPASHRHDRAPDP